MSVYKLAVHHWPVMFLGILSSLFTMAAALIFHRLCLCAGFALCCCLSLQPMAMACFWKPLLPRLPLVTWIQVYWLRPWPFAHSIFYVTSLGLDLLLVHGHMVVPTGRLMDQWLWISRTHPVEWLFTGDGVVLEMDGSAKLSSGWWTMGIGQSGLISADPLDFLIICWNLGALAFPGVASSLDPGLPTVRRWLSAVWHRHFSFFYCAVQSRILLAFCILWW